jgi:GAF domain-containing protein/stage II sporulation SpoE-like protein
MSVDVPGTPELEARLHRIEVSDLTRLDDEDLLAELLDRARELLKVDTAAVLLLAPLGDHLFATAALGIDEEVHQGVRIPVGKGFAGRVAREKRPVILEEVTSTNVHNPLLLEKGIRSLLGVPLIAGDEVLGVLHVGTLAPRRFTDEDSDLLQVVADRVALAVHSRLSHEERVAAAALQRSLLPTTPPSVADLEWSVLEPPVDLPLGVDASRHRHTSTIAVSAGMCLCFYTDGLIERRHSSLDAGFERLRAAMFAGHAEAVCATVMSRLVGNEIVTDDIAVLTLALTHDS